MKRLFLGALASSVVLAITCYAYNAGPVGVVNGVLAILLLLRLFGRPNEPVRADGGAYVIPAALAPSRREEPGEQPAPRLREWPGQGLVRGGRAMLVTRQVDGDSDQSIGLVPASCGRYVCPNHGDDQGESATTCEPTVA